jgi:hypothetical protein
MQPIKDPERMNGSSGLTYSLVSLITGEVVKMGTERIELGK